MIFKRKKISSIDKINKSKKIIKEEKEKIKEEKKKLKQEKNQSRKEKREIKNSKETYTKKEVIIAIIFSMVIGALSFILIFYIALSKNNLISTYKDLSGLISTYNTIVNNYYGEIDKDEIIENAITSMIESVGDVFTTYSDTEETSTFKEEVEGIYEGIGCTVTTNSKGQIEIVSLYEDGPAAESGLEVGDIIIEIDGEDYTDKTSTEAAEYIKSTDNKKIKITILRNDEEQEITVTKQSIEIQVVEGETYEQDGHKIGYISISIFSSVSDTQFKKVLEELEDEDIEGLIIDVRDNGGGYLSAVTNIANMLLEKGQIIYQLESSSTTDVIKDTTKEKRKYPIAVIINEASASASEILASCIKESYNGLVVGTNSYGKGTVQKTKELANGSMIKYTTENWLTPNGNWIDGTGVEPTNEVKQDDSSKYDTQLTETLKLIIEELE